MRAHLTTRVCVACPNCGQGEHTVSHLFYDLDKNPGRTFGPWYCDACYRGFNGKINSPDDIELELIDEQRIPTLNLLILPPQEKPVYFIVENGRFPRTGISNAIDDDHNRYYFEEHSCPTNFINCERIISESDTDPHGLFEYVAAVDKPSNHDHDQDDGDYWKNLFPQPFA